MNAFPGPESLPGTMCFEPKWDGYRIALFRGSHGTELWSRQGKNLSRYFPELVNAADELIPAGCIVDGEAVVWTGGRLSFESLQQRLSAGKNRLVAVANELPANFVAFDVLCVAGHDARSLRLRERRALLQELADGWTPPFSLSPLTTDLDLALQWFKDLATAGLEGLIIKGDSQPYLGGQRVWLKYKRRSEIDIICGAVVGPIDRPTEIVAGLPIDGALRIVGRSSVLRSSDSQVLAQWLKPPEGPHPWPEMVKGSTLDRFNRDASPVALTLVEPVVVEVSADSAWSGQAFRHALRFIRVRPELPPEEVPLPR
ncbi:ATP-dependent DNA ligase [Arthrobacter sp. NPDC056691]|uniref:ATP-dependent DNA ligase n=1 Tax=Arthrobacter sp. NPDC056691 TaxID=3345913 RepID=UPI00366FA46A